MRCIGTNIKITVNHLTVSYNDEGPDEAPVIIFIHGFPFNKSMWDKQAGALKDNYRVIAYDIRGHGNSDGNGEFSIENFAHDLIGLMDRLEIDKAILCGLSMGGYIALHAFEKNPHSFDALILSDTQCAADTLEGKQKRMKTIESIQQNGVEQYADESIKNLFAPGSFSTKQKEIATVREMMVNTPEYSLCSTLRALSERKETCSKLQDIKVPVLIIVGKEDRVTPSAAAELLQEKIQDSSMHIIEHAGHVSNLEQPGEFNALLKKFLHPFAKKQDRLMAAASN